MQKKNRWEETPYDAHAQTAFLEVIRRAPGPRGVHVVDELDVRRFVKLLPDWPQLSKGLHSIVLDSFDEGTDGFCRYDGVIVLHAWPRAMIREVSIEYYRQHSALVERIGVPCDFDAREVDPPFARCWFDASTARAFLLMHVFLHELGHHIDPVGRGEDFAEEWAFEREALLWPRYREVFGMRARPQPAVLSSRA